MKCGLFTYFFQLLIKISGECDPKMGNSWYRNLCFQFVSKFRRASKLFRITNCPVICYLDSKSSLF